VRTIIFHYKDDVTPDANIGAPAFLMNVNQLANWTPVRNDLCRIYRGYARGGEMVYCDWTMVRGEVQWR